MPDSQHSMGGILDSGNFYQSENSEQQDKVSLIIDDDLTQQQQDLEDKELAIAPLENQSKEKESAVEQFVMSEIMEAIMIHLH